MGWHFENLLQQAFLHRSLHLKETTTEFRYLHHEVVEESQHTLMFNELYNRVGLPAKGIPALLLHLAETIVPVLAQFAPVPFFILVLGGEDPIDFLQRKWIAEGVQHPLVEKVVRTHVTEEARHVSFAQTSITRYAAEFGELNRHIVGIMAPLALGVLARMMLVPPLEMRRDVNMPRGTVAAAFRTDAGRQYLKDSVAKPRKLMIDAGLMTAPAKLLWKAVGLWDETAADAPRNRAAAKIATPA